MGTTTGARIKTLCCACGNVRTVSANANPRTTDPYSTGEGRDADYLAKMHERGFYLGMQPYWRCLRTLVCSACKGHTRHADIRHDEGADWAESQDRARDLDRRQLNARLGRLELAGIDVRWESGDGWHERAVLELHQYRDPSGETWLIVVRESAKPDALIRRLEEVERVIDRQEMPGDWSKEPGAAYEWRGKRFLNY
jgi:hypothetical protein